MKVLAIASAGGHWIQLLRLTPAFKEHQLIFASTKPGFEKTVAGYSFHCVPDANRNDKLGILKLTFQVFKLVYTLKPSVVITTGAAPGLLGLLAGKILGAETIWVDSIANVEKLSLSGKIALRIADRVYTQWPDLAKDKILFHGNVLS